MQLRPSDHAGNHVGNHVNVMDQFKASQLRLHQWSASLPMRSDLHIARKLWHAATGILIVSLYSAGVPKPLALILLSAFLAFTLTMEVLRMRNPILNEKCVKMFGAIIRTNEVKKISTIPYYVASAVVAIGIFPKPVAILSLLFLAVGDPCASFFGVLFKNRSVKIFGEKSLHGTAACFGVCALMTYVYLRSGGMVGLELIRMTLLGGFAGALAETLPLEIDDNFTIPVISGLILWAGLLVIHFV